MPATGDPAGPLAGVRVVDCSTVLAGPYCTMVLGDLGADVVKIEPPEGDATRGWGPPWVGSDADGTRTATYYLAINRNKRSLRLDLRQEAGRTVLRALLRDADVVVENFKVGGFARLGFSDDVLNDLNRDLVHLAISGYGTTGPDAGKPGYDFVVQAVSGLMSITGEPDGRPLKVGVAITDVVTGIFGVVSVLAGLLARERGMAGAGGRGQRLDLSLLQSTLAVLVNQAQSTLATGEAPGRLGNAHPSIVPYETFTTADGEIAVGVGSEKQWRALCDVLGLEGIVDAPSFATNGARVTNRRELVATLNARFARDTRESWLRVLDAAAIPAGPIRDIREAMEAPQAVALGLRVPLEHEALGRMDQVASPLGLSSTPVSIRRPPPMLGEHSREILSEAGYDAGAIERLAADGVI
jgi:crotonobetainyl-CoA:carnitine CoA-transferase CaiB-like acyl-CoA transferase